MQHTIGSRPISLEPKLDAPLLWGAIGNVGTAVSNSVELNNRGILLLTKKFNKLLKGHRVDVQHDIKSYLEPLKESLNNLSGAFSTVLTSLKEGIDFNYEKLRELKRKTNVGHHYRYVGPGT